MSNSFATGVRFKLRGEVFLVRQQLMGDRFEIENLSFGGIFIKTYTELTDEWNVGNLVFEVKGKHAKLSPEDTIATEYTFADFESLPERYQQEAWRRYELITPLLSLNRSERTKSKVYEYAETLRDKEEAQSQINAPEGKKASRKGIYLGDAKSGESIWRYLRDFLEAGRTLSSLVPELFERSLKMKKRLDPDVDEIIKQVLNECKSKPAKRSITQLHEIIVNRIDVSNKGRPLDKQLIFPDYMTVYRRVQEYGPNLVLRRQLSELEAHEGEQVNAGVRVTRPMQRVEMDDTAPDVILVDEEDRLPIGRPNMTTGLDVCTRMPTGFSVNFEPPSYRTVMLCLLTSVLKKPDVKELYATKNSWDVYGHIEKVAADNGKAYKNNHMKIGCGEIGTTVDYMPRRTPWYKPHIERVIKTKNDSLIHLLPGSTLSNIMELGDYDPSKTACISMQGFLKILYIFWVDYYAQKEHEGIEDMPARLWERKVQEGYRPFLTRSAEETRIALLPTTYRILQPVGIEFGNMVYQDSVIGRLRSTMKADERQAKIKYDPDDLSYLYLLDTTAPSSSWLKIPIREDYFEYANGLSLRKHRIIRKYSRMQAGKEDIVALADARARIQRVVEEEFLSTRKQKTRRRNAAYRRDGASKNNGREAPRNPKSSESKQEETTLSTRKQQNPQSSKPTVPPKTSSCDVGDKSGWGGDYKLPKSNG